jgi:hypothetical protein
MTMGWSRLAHQKPDHRHRAGLLRARREGLGGRCAAPFYLIELHSVSCQPAPNYRMSNWRGSVRRERNDFTTYEPLPRREPQEKFKANRLRRSPAWNACTTLASWHGCC